MPPTRLWGRVTRVRFVYDDAHPERPSESLQASEWTDVDVALLQGLEDYEATLCGGCGFPRALAWHSHTDEEWDPGEFVCHACSAKQGHEVVYASPRLTLSREKLAELPPFVFPDMTTAPSRRTPTGG